MGVKRLISILWTVVEDRSFLRVVTVLSSEDNGTPNNEDEDERTFIHVVLPVRIWCSTL
jgi:hypothetical protein